MKTFTAMVYKKDGRTKSGERQVVYKDHESISAAALANLYRETYPGAQGFRVETHETYVTKKSLMGDQEFQERFDTPYYCSPSSETYWSM